MNKIEIRLGALLQKTFDLLDGFDVVEVKPSDLHFEFNPLKYRVLVGSQLAAVDDGMSISAVGPALEYDIIDMKELGWAEKYFWAGYSRMANRVVISDAESWRFRAGSTSWQGIDNTVTT